MRTELQPRRIESKKDAEAFLLGLALLSTGGGGTPERGRIYLYELLDEGLVIEWQSIDSLAPEALTCSVFGMGSVAPHEQLDEVTRTNLGFRGEQVSRPGVRAVGELEALLGRAVDGIVPFELGGFNTIVAVDAALRLSLPLVDGDYVGRALPEMSQALPAALGFQPHPLAICDHWGNSLLLKDCPSAAVAEMLGKMISVVTKTPDMFATCAHAAFALAARDATTAVVRDSLTRALGVGRRIQEARETEEDPVAAAARALEGVRLFDGTVRHIDWVDGAGYMEGTTFIDGQGAFAGETARVWFRNENHVLWRDDDVYATSPDLISIVTRDDSTPTTNTRLKVGDQVSVLGAPCDPRYTKPGVLELTEPRHYGIDASYVPLREATPSPADSGARR